MTSRHDLHHPRWKPCCNGSKRRCREARRCCRRCRCTCAWPSRSWPWLSALRSRPFCCRFPRATPPRNGTEPADTPVAQTEPDARLHDGPERPARGGSDRRNGCRAKDRGQAREAPPAAELAAANAGADSVEKELALTTAPATGASGSRAASGGREAGDSADTLEDTGFSPSWQGELARKVLSSTAAADNVPARADPSRAADYAAAPSPPDDTSAAARHSPAPAVPPEARPRVRLGPAEQAYVRAYFSGSGATP